MLSSLRSLKWREAVPRIAADFLIVHLSVIFAMAVSVVYQIYRGQGDEAAQITAGFSRYYKFFWLLSPIFPCVFLLSGLYTHARRYVGRQKVLAIFQSVGVAVILFLGVNALLFGSETIARSAALPFALIAATALSSARLLMGYLQQRYDVRLKSEVIVTAARGRVLVVGGAGYIGSLLVSRLLEKGYTVRVLDSLLYGEEPLRCVRDHPHFELIAGDCRNIQDVVKAVRGIEAIVHLAAIVGDPACEQDRGSALEVNYAATRMLIEIAKGHGVRRLVFASSCSVYGASDVEVDEASMVNPISLYGQTKVQSERALLEGRTEAFSPTILRFATVFGLSYRPRFDLVVNLLTAKAVQDGVITIYNGHQWRPFIHVRDAAEAITAVLEAPVKLIDGEIFNVGDSRFNYTLADIGKMIGGVCPGTRVERVDNGDLRNYRVNFRKFQQRTGFHSLHSVQDGILEIKTALERCVIVNYTDVRYNNHRYLEAVGGPGHKNDVDAHVMAAFAGSPAR